ncbi:MAG: DUF5317 family protein [Acidimicrobiales bacterium]
MAILPLSVVAGLAVGMARGGRLASLSQVRLRALGLVVVAIAVQVLVGIASSRRLVAPELRIPLVVSSDLAVGWWLALNVPLRRRGQQLALLGIGAGWLANLLPIALYGAMPVSRAALREAGLGNIAVRYGHLGKHLLATHGSFSAFGLGDWIPVRALAAVLSPGDLAMAAGIAAFVAISMGSRHEGGGHKKRPTVSTLLGRKLA